MRIAEIAEILEAEIVTNFSNEEKDVTYVFASDLMSDVLAYANSESLLVTGLSNAQVVRTAEMMDMDVIIFVRGKKISIETLELAKENRITVLSTNYTMFKTCGLLYSYGMKGIE